MSETKVTRVDTPGSKTIAWGPEDHQVKTDSVHIILQRMSGDAGGVEGDTIGIGDGNIVYTVHTSAVRALLDAHDEKLAADQPERLTSSEMCKSCGNDGESCTCDICADCGQFDCECTKAEDGPTCGKCFMPIDECECDHVCAKCGFHRCQCHMLDEED